MILVHILLKLGQLKYILKDNLIVTFIIIISIKRTSWSFMVIETVTFFLFRNIPNFSLFILDGGEVRRNLYHTQTHSEFLNIVYGVLNMFYIKVFSILKNYFSLPFKWGTILLSLAYNKQSSNTFNILEARIDNQNQVTKIRHPILQHIICTGIRASVQK